MYVETSDSVREGNYVLFLDVSPRLTCLTRQPRINLLKSKSLVHLLSCNKHNKKEKCNKIKL